MTTRGFEYQSLSLCDALDLAILIEEEAKERYEEFTDQMEKHHTAEAAQFFRFMAGNEEKHRAELAARREQLFGDRKGNVTRAMIFDIEAPEYDEARAFMTPRQALETALRSEEKARAFFDEALPHVEDGDVRKLFQELLAEEVEHKELVEREIAKLAPDDGFSQRDFEDEPVPQ
jgi:rubrerythrin